MKIKLKNIKNCLIRISSYENFIKLSNNFSHGLLPVATTMHCKMVDICRKITKTILIRNYSPVSRCENFKNAFKIFL